MLDLGKRLLASTFRCETPPVTASERTRDGGGPAELAIEKLPLVPLAGGAETRRQLESVAGVGRGTRVQRTPELTVPEISTADIALLESRAPGTFAFESKDQGAHLILLPKDGDVPFERAVAMLESPEFPSGVQLVLERQGDQLTGAKTLDTGHRIEILIQEYPDVDVFAPGSDRPNDYYFHAREDDRETFRALNGTIRVEERSSDALAKALVGDARRLLKDELWGTQNCIPRRPRGEREWARTRAIALDGLSVDQRLEITRALKAWARKERSDVTNVTLQTRVMDHRGGDGKVHVSAFVEFGRDTSATAARKIEIRRRAAEIVASYAEYDELARSRAQGPADASEDRRDRSEDHKLRAHWNLCDALEREVKIESVADLEAAAIVLKSKIGRMRAWNHPIDENSPVMLERLVSTLEALISRPDAAYCTPPLSLTHGMCGAWKLARSMYLPSNYEMTELMKIIGEVGSYMDRVDHRFKLPESLKYAGATKEEKEQEFINAVRLDRLGKLASAARSEAERVPAKYAEIKADVVELGRAAERLAEHPLASLFRSDGYRWDGIKSMVESGKLHVASQIERLEPLERDEPTMNELVGGHVREITRELDEAFVALELLAKR